MSRGLCETDTLPHNSNLNLWAKLSTPGCQLCQEKQPLHHTQTINEGYPAHLYGKLWGVILLYGEVTEFVRQRLSTNSSWGQCCNGLFAIVAVSCMLSLECLQKFVAQTILCQCRRYSTSSARRELSLSTLSSRRDIRLAQHLFKAIHALFPPYLQSLLNLTSATHGHCTRQTSMVSDHLPLPRTNFEKNTFSYRGAAIWNSLPTNARIASTISAFNSIIHPICFTLNGPSA